MANIRKIDGKTGVSYKITVTHGRDTEGKQVRHYMTWTPAQGMTDRQIEKAVQKAAFEFEQQIEQGVIADRRQTFAQYADYVIDLKAKNGAKPSTIDRYRSMLPRINAAIGHLKLGEIRPQHLNMFYSNLTEEGVRDSRIKAVAKKDIGELIAKTKLNKTQFAERAGTAASNVRAAIKGDTVSKDVADAISAALGNKTESLFRIERDTTPLSVKTVIEHHRLISAIFTQAEKELLVPYNPARRATPPKLERKEAECFQPDEVLQILECLENEPIKWRTLTHLLIVTGCRRGELVGLRWKSIDWDNSQIKIERALLYSPEKGIYESTTKTGETRYIKLPAETMQLLKRYRAWHTELRFRNGDQWVSTEYVFTRDNGDLLHPDSVTQWLSGFSKKYDLPPIHPHKFRHTMASMLINDGTDIVTVSKRLGHAKVSTTTDIYSHIIKEADAKAADSIADSILRKAEKSG